MQTDAVTAFRSRFAIQRDFRAVTGKTVLQWIQNEKLLRVKEMLRKTTTPIDGIGQFCGFKSPAHLKTLFKARFGMTMSAYRMSDGHGCK